MASAAAETGNGAPPAGTAKGKGKGKGKGVAPPPPSVEQVAKGKGASRAPPYIEFTAELSGGAFPGDGEHGFGLHCIGPEVVKVAKGGAADIYNQSLPFNDPVRIQKHDFLVEINGTKVASRGPEWDGRTWVGVVSLLLRKPSSTVIFRRNRSYIRVVSLSVNGERLLGLSPSGDEVFSLDTSWRPIAQAGELKARIASAIDSSCQCVTLLCGNDQLADEDVIGDVGSIIARLDLKSERTWTYKPEPEPEEEEEAAEALPVETIVVPFQVARMRVQSNIEAMVQHIYGIAMVQHNRLGLLLPNGSFKYSTKIMGLLWRKGSVKHATFVHVEKHPNTSGGEALPVDTSPIDFQTARQLLMLFLGAAIVRGFSMKQRRTSLTGDSTALIEKLQQSPMNCVDSEISATAAWILLDNMTSAGMDVEAVWSTTRAILSSTDWIIADSRQARIRFFPRELKNEVILVQEELNHWRLTCSNADKFATADRCFRRSKCNLSSLESEVVPWESLIYGVSDFDGWVKFEMEKLKRRLAKKVLHTLAWCAALGHQSAVSAIVEVLHRVPVGQATDYCAEQANELLTQLLDAVPDANKDLTSICIRFIQAFHPGRERLLGDAVRRLSRLDCSEQEQVSISDALQLRVTHLAPAQKSIFSVVVPCDQKWRSDPRLMAEAAKIGVTLESVEQSIRIDVIDKCGYPVGPEYHLQPLFACREDSRTKYLRISYPENAFIFESERPAGYVSGWSHVAPFVAPLLKRTCADIGDDCLSALCRLSCSGSVNDRCFALEALAVHFPRGHNKTLEAACQAASASDAAVRTQALEVLLAVVRPEDRHAVCTLLDIIDPHAQRILNDVLLKLEKDSYFSVLSALLCCMTRS